MLTTHNKTRGSSKLLKQTAHWSVGKVFFLNAVFGTIVAVVIWLAPPWNQNPGFLDNWVHAQLIGGIICSLILLTNRAVRRYSSLPNRLLLFVMPLIVVIGFYLGTALARLLLQLPSMDTNTYDDKHMLLVSLIITFIVTVAITWFFTAQGTITDLRIKSAEESERAAQAQLAMLIAQIEPHMLFNTLANLKALIATDPHKARVMLDSLIEFLRATLDHSRATSVTLVSECEMLENYLSLMKIRMADRLSYEISLPETLEDCLIPSLILQPLVENAITHGIEPSIEGGHILVNAETHERLLKLTVEDTGIGMSYTKTIDIQQNDTASSEGFGFANVQARCAALPGGSTSVLSPLPRSDRGTRITLQLPMDLEV